MGYEDIIWTLYKYNHQDFDKIISIIKNKVYFAITMPIDAAKRGLSKKIKEETQTKTLVHTVNFRREVVKMIFIHKVTDVYTDRVLNDVNNIFIWFYKKKLINE